MKCFDCNHENEKGSKFCSNCGKSFKPKNNSNKDSHAYPNQNAIKMHADRLQERANSPFKMIVLYAVTLIFMLFVTSGNLKFFAISAIVLGLLCLTLYFKIKKAVVEDFYYTIPSSKDEQGNHRCIFCGNKGIHKSTIYRTSITVNTCTKCRKQLFVN
jgi:ribosomal protein L37AE/L43A